ncbi:MAG TPA: pilus assembly protein TadG-related protein [Acidimicrobiales bacterium]
MTPDDAPAGDRLSGDDDGFVAVWFALLLLVLLAFAGVGIDVANWWFTAQRAQRAADAAALGGVVFLPGDPVTAASTAVDISGRNGYRNGVNASVVATQEPNPTRLRVKVTTVVDNYFVGLVAADRQTISRQAVADFQGPVPMGSPENRLGNDPDQPAAALPQMWLNLAARGANKANGDRYQSTGCGVAAYQCSGTNNEYSPNGYFFTVRVSAIGSGPLTFQAFDPVYATVGDNCDVNLPTAAQATALKNTGRSEYADAPTRYATGSTGAAAPFCTGDNSVGGTGMISTFIVRAPDNTPWSNTDNPVVSTASCQPRQYGAWDQAVYPLLSPSSPTYNPTFASQFRRWVTYCQIPAGTVVRGDYIVQVRSNALSGSPLVASSPSTGGHNRFSMRAGFGTTTLSGTGVSLFATGRLPIYMNATGSDTRFFVARIPPSTAGRTLHLEFFDVGDAAAAGSITILRPLSYGESAFPSCRFKRDNSVAVNTAPCTLTGVSAAGGYNGRLVTADIPLATNYTCNMANALDCWVKIRFTYPSGTSVQDTTTWAANVVGDPVRLVE